jgi:hypothetical protein
LIGIINSCILYVLEVSLERLRQKKNKDTKIKVGDIFYCEEDDCFFVVDNKWEYYYDDIDKKWYPTMTEPGDSINYKYYDDFICNIFDEE